ncbi:MAG: hypothetical protein AAFX08_04530 [Pseudomonadota bacterium]
MILARRAPGLRPSDLVRRAVPLAVVLFSACCAVSANAQLLVAPLRAVLSADTPNATIEVSNPSDRIVDVRADWLDLAADIDGYLAAGADARARLSAAPFLNLEPASMRLEPGGRARVQLTLRKGADIPAGERRSHLLLSAAPARSSIRRASGGLNADISLSISLPVLVRGAGDVSSVRARFEATHLDRDNAGDLMLVSNIQRSGTFSPYGALIATFEPKPGRQQEELARLENVAAPIDSPAARIQLPLGVDVLPAGTLKLRFEGRAEFEGKTFASKRFDIAPPPGATSE